MSNIPTAESPFDDVKQIRREMEAVAGTRSPLKVVQWADKNSLWLFNAIQHVLSSVPESED